jgi:uncharacterized membrane protein
VPNNSNFKIRVEQSAFPPRRFGSWASRLLQRRAITVRGVVMHALLVFSALPLFLGALLSDWAYAASYQVQWTNFASWLIGGGLLFAGFALLWALIDYLRSRAARDRRHGLYLAALLASVVLGFVNALVHAKDAWAAMPAGLWLSVLVFVLVLVAGGLGVAKLRRRVER